jgi:hypothetical protein
MQRNQQYVMNMMLRKSHNMRVAQSIAVAAAAGKAMAATGSRRVERWGELCTRFNSRFQFWKYWRWGWYQCSVLQLLLLGGTSNTGSY